MKNLANVSCKVPARDPSSATLCLDDTIIGVLYSWTTAILLPKIIRVNLSNLWLFRNLLLLISQEKSFSLATSALHVFVGVHPRICSPPFARMVATIHAYARQQTVQIVCKPGKTRVVGIIFTIIAFGPCGRRTRFTGYCFSLGLSARLPSLRPAT